MDDYNIAFTPGALAGVIKWESDSLLDGAINFGNYKLNARLRRPWCRVHGGPTSRGVPCEQCAIALPDTPRLGVDSWEIYYKTNAQNSESVLSPDFSPWMVQALTPLTDPLTSLLLTEILIDRLLVVETWMDSWLLKRGAVILPDYHIFRPEDASAFDNLLSTLGGPLLTSEA